VKPDETRRAEFFVAALKKIGTALTRYLVALRAQAAPAVEAALAEANAAGAEARGYATALDVTQCGGYSGG
jgi:hypothetical protein